MRTKNVILTSKSDGSVQVFGSVASACTFLKVSANYINTLLKRGKAGNDEYLIEVKEKEYAVYRGDDLIVIGTLQEVADSLGMSLRNAHWHKSPSARKRAKNKAIIICEIPDGE